MAAGIESALWGPMPDDSWVQASLAIDASGLGMRSANELAMPSFLASRTMARPLVAHMAKHMKSVGLCSEEEFLAEYDKRTKAASEQWLAQLPGDVRGEAIQALQEGADFANERWQNWSRGIHEVDASGTEMQAGSGPERSGANLVAAVGQDDSEHPSRQHTSGPIRLQHRLIRIVDSCVAQGLIDKFTAEERWSDLDRIADLSERNANHEWLWSIHPHKTKRMTDVECVAAIRLRLGCGGPDEPAICGRCGTSILGTNGVHALCCARGESVRGHHAVRDELHHIAIPVHSAAEIEPEGLIPSRPSLRPADILTGAFHNGRLVAVDVGIICPAAAGAGRDCVQIMDRRKRDRMAPYQQELEAGAIEYHPFAISCWGRMHPSAYDMLRKVARVKARREGLASEAAILHRLVARITSCIWIRAARMVLQCKPLAQDEEPLQEPACDNAALIRAGTPGTADLPAYDGASA